MKIERVKIPFVHLNLKTKLTIIKIFYLYCTGFEAIINSLENDCTIHFLTLKHLSKMMAVIQAEF